MKKQIIKKENLEKAFDLPATAFNGEPHIEILGSSRCVVDGLKSIVEYSDNSIKISLGKKVISFKGYDLCINNFTKSGAVVEGNIVSMDFSEE